MDSIADASPNCLTPSVCCPASSTCISDSSPPCHLVIMSSFLSIALLATTWLHYSWLTAMLEKSLEMRSQILGISDTQPLFRVFEVIFTWIILGEKSSKNTRFPSFLEFCILLLVFLLTIMMIFIPDWISGDLLQITGYCKNMISSNRTLGD